uniref:Hspb associated protein 1 n=1 Tax=Callorhinchus milii TaxID=7868 RepID=A0A4W3JSF5_CALMI
MRILKSKVRTSQNASRNIIILPFNTALFTSSRNTKPFKPEEARNIVESLQKPAVFCNMVSDWPARQWDVQRLSEILDGKPIEFRIGRRKLNKVPQFETQCEYVKATLEEFLVWVHGGSNVLPEQFSNFPRAQYWAYADYKYIARLLEDKAELFQDLMWSDFGFPGRDGRDSTLWIGSEGASTPCHLDCYGCNLVLQVQGRKRWHLFPPEDTSFLYPTRIPYEESSVFSKVNVVNPDVKMFPQFGRAKPHIVTLHPGQVLFVPRHWWHYVESLDPISVSMNSWIELAEDDEARVSEALTRTAVYALKSAENLADAGSWLNPTEVNIMSHETNLRYLNLAVQACNSKRSSSNSPKKRKRESSKVFPASERDPVGDESAIPFGPHLLPVGTAHAGSGGSGCVSCDSEQCEGPLDGDDVELTHCRGRTGLNGGSEDGLTTDDLLECLVHPDVIRLATRILLDRQSSR